MDNRKSKRPLRMKIISMGNAEVGKSCIIKRYCEKRFVHKYLATIGIDYGVTKVNVKDRDVKVNIFDMAGHPIFYEVRNEFYKDTQGALLVYDVSDRHSFEALDHWLLEMQNEIGNQADHDNVVMCVCANKVDKKRVVDQAEGKIWADSRGFRYFETSAQTGEGVSEVFQAEGKIWADSRGFRYFETSAQTGEGVSEVFQALFEEVVTAAENGGKRAPFQTTLGYTKDQIDAIQRLKNAKGDYDRLGLREGATKDDINKAYRKLAVLLHPDKNVAPGSEEAFKILVAARTALLKRC